MLICRTIQLFVSLYIVSYFARLSKLGVFIELAQVIKCPRITLKDQSNGDQILKVPSGLGDKFYGVRP